MEVNELITQLEAANPTPSPTAALDALGGTWRLVGPGRYHPPRHMMPFDLRNEQSKCESKKRRAIGPAHITRHVIRCRLIHETKVQMRVDDVAGNICQALAPGVHEQLGAVCAAGGGPVAAGQHWVGINTYWPPTSSARKLPATSSTFVS